MAPFLITARIMFIANILRFRAMEFCHSFGSSVSLACIETKDENEHLKEWLLEHGKTVILVSLYLTWIYFSQKLTI